MNIVDLHVHSTVSDGTMTPKQVVHYAKEKGLRALALTDHDTIDGLEEAFMAGKTFSIEVIPGIELAAEYKDVELHILGYYVDHHDSAFLHQLDHWKKAREHRNEKMIVKLNQLGFPITLKDLKNLSKGNVITRAHYGKWFLQKGYVKSISEAFQKYIGADCPGYVRRQLPTPKECISMIKEAKGIPVLAHPFLYSFSDQELSAVLKQLKQEGLRGIEVMHSTHTLHQEKTLWHLAHHYGLLMTGGSDFHGTNKPDIDIGVGKGNLQIPYKMVESLKKESSF